MIPTIAAIAMAASPATTAARPAHARTLSTPSAESSRAFLTRLADSSCVLVGAAPAGGPAAAGNAVMRDSPFVPPVRDIRGCREGTALWRPGGGRLIHLGRDRELAMLSLSNPGACLQRIPPACPVCSIAARSASGMVERWL